MRLRTLLPAFLLLCSAAFAQIPAPPQNGGTGVKNNNASKITISGAYPLTINLTASTNIILPTSGTLLTSGTLSAAIDTAFGSSQGSVLYRSSTAWTVLTPGTSGFFLETLGPSANPAWAAAAGGSGCTISGGSQYQIVVNNGSSGCSSSANGSVQVGALSLGASGTLGSVTMGNATSGTLTIEPVTGALGTVTLLAPAISDTLVTLTATQTLTNKTLTAPVMTAPVLGTPASGNGSNLTNIPFTALTGNIVAAQMLALATGDVYQGNGSNQPAAVSLSAAIDAAIGSTQGDILYRGASTWAVLAPGTSGYFLQTAGASANPAWAAQAGSTGCTVSGGSQYQIIVNNGSSGCSSSANGSLQIGALTLGASGTLGSVTMGNATSGTVTIQPVTGALGTVTANLPANSGVLAELNYAQTWSAAQTFTNSDIKLLGSSTGATTIASANAGGTNYTATIPAITDTFDMLTTTATLTNKTLTAPVMTAPVLGTIASGNGAALTGLTWSQIGSTPTTLAGYGIINALSTSLVNTKIWVGNGSGLAAQVNVSGDATLANTGALTVTASNGVAFGTAAFDNVGTSGATLCLLNANCTFSGTLTLSGNNTYSGVSSFTGSLKVQTRTFTTSGTITLSATTDYLLCVNKGTGAPTAVTLPTSPATGLTYLVKDCKGDAATNNITISPASGLIDGSSTYVISNNYGSIGLTYTGSAWSLN